MNYIVRVLPSVTVELASAERVTQDHFQQLCADIAINPFARPGFPWITEDWADDGTRIYAYSDDVFPYVIQYVFFEATPDADGVITVIGLRRHRR